MVRSAPALKDLLTREKRPFYFYDLNDARDRARALLKSGLKVHFAMKANSNARLLSMFADWELTWCRWDSEKGLVCGFAPSRVIFSGVAKGREELDFAVAKQIGQINVESFQK